MRPYPEEANSTQIGFAFGAERRETAGNLRSQVGETLQGGRHGTIL